MKRTIGVVGVIVAGLAAVGAAAVLGASSASAWDGAAVQTGLRLYARLATAGQQPPLAFLLPVIAMAASFNAGSRLARRIPRRSQARVAAMPGLAIVRYGILFSLGAIFALVYAVSRGLL